jgi:ribosome-associated protein
MADTNAIAIGRNIEIPLSEINISFIRSSGPGGQHVNKTSTQAEITFDLANSPSIPEEDRSWLMSRLHSKLDSSGVLRITSQEFRSQLRNKNAAIEKLQTMLADALQRPKKRKKTKPSLAAKRKRVESKRKVGEKKRLRGNRDFQ